MAQVIVTESSLQNIAGAIRSKLGTQDTYTPSEMAGAISQIHGDPVLEALSVNANGTYTPSSGKDGFSQAVVNVPNSYLAGDEGKVVSGGALVAQSSQSITQNGTYNTTLKNQAIVNVPNSYSASDEGKVVDNGALVAQSSQTITQNGTYDTTLINQLVANISGGGGGGSADIDVIANITATSTFSGYSVVAPQYAYGEDGGYWCANNSTGQYYQIELSEAVRLSKVKFANARRVSTTTYWYTSGVELQGSNDNFSTYDTILTATGLDDSENVREYTVNTQTKYKCYRFVLSPQGSAYVCLYKVELFGASSTNIISGTDAPTASVGSDGSIYLQYNENTDEIEYAKLKVNGTWQNLIGSDIDDVNT